MSLPNFVNFEPFNVLRRKMRAENLGRFEFDLPQRDAPGEGKASSKAGKKAGLRAAAKSAGKTGSKARKRGSATARSSDK